ncbi:uncharacterized protein LOC126995572 isoform X3 [Eriocheir sinensis]|uniref:uncharacterized protein LOC126995572 isoform X3 n=1 Tax=Eriocheir sinensis TaxID=95602 RepID=UPI0021C71E35|nr:uncharacterized protein LOC126995572 isoform X3 [Eriocheir sinensis]
MTRLLTPPSTHTDTHTPTDGQGMARESNSCLRKEEEEEEEGGEEKRMQILKRKSVEGMVEEEEEEEDVMEVENGMSEEEEEMTKVEENGIGEEESEEEETEEEEEEEDCSESEINEKQGRDSDVETEWDRNIYLTHPQNNEQRKRSSIEGRLLETNGDGAIEGTLMASYNDDDDESDVCVCEKYERMINDEHENENHSPDDEDERETDPEHNIINGRLLGSYEDGDTDVYVREEDERKKSDEKDEQENKNDSSDDKDEKENGPEQEEVKGKLLQGFEGAFDSKVCVHEEDMRKKHNELDEDKKENDSPDDEAKKENDPEQEDVKGRLLQGYEGAFDSNVCVHEEDMRKKHNELDKDKKESDSPDDEAEKENDLEYDKMKGGLLQNYEADNTKEHKIVIQQDKRKHNDQLDEDEKENDSPDDNYEGENEPKHEENEKNEPIDNADEDERTHNHARDESDTSVHSRDGDVTLDYATDDDSDDDDVDEVRYGRMREDAAVNSDSDVDTMRDKDGDDGERVLGTGKGEEHVLDGDGNGDGDCVFVHGLGEEDGIRDKVKENDDDDDDDVDSRFEELFLASEYQEERKEEKEEDKVFCNGKNTNISSMAKNEGEHDIESARDNGEYNQDAQVTPPDYSNEGEYAPDSGREEDESPDDKNDAHLNPDNENEAVYAPDSTRQSENERRNEKENESIAMTKINSEDDSSIMRHTYSLERNGHFQDIHYINGDDESDNDDDDDEFLYSVKRKSVHDGTNDEEEAQESEEDDESKNELISEGDVQKSAGESDHFPGGLQDSKEGDKTESESAKEKEIIYQEGESSEGDSKIVQTTTDIREYYLNNVEFAEDVMSREEHVREGTEDSAHVSECAGVPQDIHIRGPENERDSDKERICECAKEIDAIFATLLDNEDAREGVTRDDAAEDVQGEDDDREHKMDNDHDPAGANVNGGHGSVPESLGNDDDDVSESDKSSEDVPVSSSFSDDDEPEQVRGTTCVPEGAPDHECVAGHELKGTHDSRDVPRGVVNHGDAPARVHGPEGVQERVIVGTVAPGGVQDTSGARGSTRHVASVPLCAEGAGDSPEPERSGSGGPEGAWRATLPPHTGRGGADVTDGVKTPETRHTGSRLWEPVLASGCGYSAREGGSHPAPGVEGGAGGVAWLSAGRWGGASEGRDKAGQQRLPRRVSGAKHQADDPLACLRLRPAPLPGPRCTCGTAASPWKTRPLGAQLEPQPQLQEPLPQGLYRGLPLTPTALPGEDRGSLSNPQAAGRGGGPHMAASNPTGRAGHLHTFCRPVSMSGGFVPSSGPLGLAPPPTLALIPGGDAPGLGGPGYALSMPHPTRRRSVRSCILPEGAFTPPAAPFIPFPGTLRSRVQSEPNVSGRLVSTGPTPSRPATPRGFSQLFSGRRKSIASCIFPATGDEEDAAPYAKAPRGPAPAPARLPQDKLGGAAPPGGWNSPRQGCCGASPLCPAPPCGSAEPRPRQPRPARLRPHSLVIIPETQVASAPGYDQTMARLQGDAAPDGPMSQEARRAPRRSWSFSPADAPRPRRDLAPPHDAPALSSSMRRTASLRRLFTQPSLRAATDVIFPWRRGEPSKGSGRSSPAPCEATSQSPGVPLSAGQSPNSLPLRPDELTNGDARGKEGVWWRGRPGSGGGGGGSGGGGGGGGGIIRTIRKEKASSSPAFRRASLSHSEWDIRSRPWSHSYGGGEAANLSQSVCRLAVTSCEEGGTGGDERGGGAGPSSLPHMPLSSASTTSSSNSSEGSGVFQKFKKSLSLRLARKGSRDGTPTLPPPPHSAPPAAPPDPPEDSTGDLSPHPHHPHPHQQLPRRWGSFSRDDDPAKTTFLFGHPLFRSSKERRRARLRDARATKCNSADSGDSGIELVTGSGHVTTPPPPADPDLFGSLGVDSAFTASLADDASGGGGSGGGGLREPNPRAVRRTHSDVGGRGATCYSRQLSTPQPIKVRPAHRLPQHNTASLHRAKSSLKRSKGSSHLRRSVSQPLDLDKSTSNLNTTPSSTLRRCRSPDDPSSRHHLHHQRRPSVGDILNDDNTTSEDEIGMSDSEDFRGDLKRSLEEDENLIVYAEALWDHVTLDAEELVFKAGDLITVIDSADKDWWWGRISTRAGWFPAAFVRILVNQEDHQGARHPRDSRHRGPARKLSLSGLSHDQIRTNVINEIISTEQDFVKHLRDVIKGYLLQVRKRGDMFNKERIATIFGNMEALYTFQSGFLKELEGNIDWQEPHKSCIGAIFIRNREKFEIYSEYCNNHPAATSALQELYQDQRYVHFFEACRLLQEMIDISLDGFLLTPVQKICKYPLQLQELLKYTKTDHPDFNSVKGALDAMRDVALLVNERKRRMECLEKIASWQMTVEGWEGPDLLEESSQLIHQGEATKGAGGAWPKDVTLFLFDHQLVYCKRDLLKRNTFVYRGRLNLDMCEVVDMPANKDSSLNMSNGWKIHSVAKNKWYTFSCKTGTEKLKWMEAFSKERKLVAADENAGFVVGEKAKNLARVAARNQRNRPKRPRKGPLRNMIPAATGLMVSTKLKITVCGSASGATRRVGAPDAPWGKSSTTQCEGRGSVWRGGTEGATSNMSGTPSPTRPICPSLFPSRPTWHE